MRLQRDRRTWLTYGQLGVYGWFLYGFGPALTLLRDEQGFTRTVAGLHGTALALVALGGVLYTLGAVVYGVRRPDPAPGWFGFHEVFHALTIAAYVAHYAGVWVVL